VFGHCCTLTLTVLIQALGTLLGFAGAVSKEESIGLSIGYALAAATVKWFILTFLALFLHHAFKVKFPKSLLLPIVFPAAHTAVSMVVIGLSAGTFTALGGAVLDYAPMRYIAVLFGLGGVHFFVVLVGTYAALIYLNYTKIPIRQLAYANALLALAVLCCTAFIMQSDWLYQTDASRQVAKTVSVSCVLGQHALYASDAYEQVWNTTSARAMAGDRIVLMSEAAIKLFSDEQESDVISRAASIAIAAAASTTTSTTTGTTTGTTGTTTPYAPFIGVTYSKTTDGGNTYTNHLTLVGPGGAERWNYEKVGTLLLLLLLLLLFYYY
jgi:apolipoprotein N-acyltransferase